MDADEDNPPDPSGRTIIKKRAMFAPPHVRGFRDAFDLHQKRKLHKLTDAIQAIPGAKHAQDLGADVH